MGDWLEIQICNEKEEPLTTAPNRQAATGQKNVAVPKYYEMGYISSKECCPAVHSGETYVIGNLYLLRKNYVFSVGANYFSSKRD